MGNPTIKDLPPAPKGKINWPWTQESVYLPLKLQDSRICPRFTIVTPSYMQGEYLEETIRSVLLQNYPKLEYIIIDGGSVDQSIEVIKKYEKWIDYWVSEKDAGQSDAINKGFSKATGDIIAWLNSDDIYCAGILQKIATYWSAIRECHFIVGDGDWTDSLCEKSRYYVKAKAYSFEELLYYHKNRYLPQPSVFFSKEAFDKVGGLDKSLNYVMDLDLWLRLAQRYRLHYVPVCISKLRQHDRAKSIAFHAASIREANRVVVPRYSIRVGLFKRCLINYGQAYHLAVSLCLDGLRCCNNGDKKRAFILLIEAIGANSMIVLSVFSLKLFLHIITPAFVIKIAKDFLK